MSLITYYNTGDDAEASVYANYFACQTFTPVVTFSVYSIRLKIYRMGNPGNSQLYLKSTTGSPAYPYDTINFTSFNANDLPTSASWVEFRFLTTPYLTNGVTYALEINALTGNSSNAIIWRLDETSPTYAGGMYGRTAASGTWSSSRMDSLRDFMFETYNPGNMVLPDKWLRLTEQPYIQIAEIVSY